MLALTPYCVLWPHLAPPQARQIFSTCHKQTTVCSGRVLKNFFFFRYCGWNDVMHSHCRSVTLGTWPDLDLDPYLHKPALMRLLYITFWTILTDFMRWATQHKVSGLYISQALSLNLWPDPMTWPVTSKFKLKQIIGSVSRAFVCRLARVATAIGSRVIEWGCLTPPSPSKWRVAKYPSNCQVNPRVTGGYLEPPSRFSSISSKRIAILAPNFQYLLVHQFYTSWQNKISYLS